MKLYEIPQNSKIWAKCSDGSEWLTFHRIDGSASSCTTERGNRVYLKAYVELTIRPDESWDLTQEVNA